MSAQPTISLDQQLADLKAQADLDSEWMSMGGGRGFRSFKRTVPVVKPVTQPVVKAAPKVENTLMAGLKKSAAAIFSRKTAETNNKLTAA